MKLRYLFAALCLCLLLVSPAAAAGGSGTAADPYIIQTAAELQSIQNNLAAYYVLGNDINMQGYSFSPIGSSSAPFIGSLNGNGYSIINLYLNIDGYAGLFGGLMNAKIYDVYFYDCIIVGKSSSSILFGGATFGDSIELSDINIINCIIYVKEAFGGALFPQIHSGNLIISNCHTSYSTIYGGTHTSGLIGGATRGDISIDSCSIKNSCILSNQLVYGMSCIPISGVVSCENCVIENTNIYGSSYIIFPTGSSTNTEKNNTHIINRYLYASGLSYSLSGSTATFTIEDRQGAAVIETSTGAAAAINYDYGDGNTGTTDTHTYSAGIYTAGVTLSNYLQTTPQTFYTTPINIGIPTYTANTITQQDADIVIDAGQLYQAETQFVLPSTTSDLEFFADNLFVVASGNAVYTVDTATQEIIPVSTTTGTTADKIYLGENSAVITDINGNTAVYQYEENSFDYLASGNSQQIAATGNYAGVLLNGKLNIYDLTEPRKIGDVTASASQLAANDYADTFAGFTGTTLYYWWIDNGEIKSGTQTLTNTITAIKQIPQTQNYIITTTKNTIIVGISATGTYSLVSTSDTELPLTHPQATTIGVVIGVHAPNEIYIVGADGSTAGTYQTGAALNDASITKATGLYAITGGNDQQAYVLRKDQSSTWTLAQTIKANGVISHTQISTTGEYAAFVSGVNLYLLKHSSTTDANNYYLQGVIIESNGKLYSGSFTINGEKVTTDTTGKFIYQVTPGNLYKITVQGTTTEYTASNAALQQIAIRIKAGLLSTEVTYNAEYSAEAQAIVMTYDDSAGKTTAVNWNVYETANNTLIATYTGNSASFPIAPGDVYNNYYVQLSADRGAATVTNTWSITPAGGQPVDLYGLDEDGRNIIFGFLLLLLAGLFGVMHSRSGAIIVAFAACIMRYLELITIPWILIIIAAVLAIVAAIAHGGLNR